MADINISNFDILENTLKKDDSGNLRFDIDRTVQVTPPNNGTYNVTEVDENTATDANGNLIDGYVSEDLDFIVKVGNQQIKKVTKRFYYNYVRVQDDDNSFRQYTMEFLFKAKCEGAVGETKSILVKKKTTQNTLADIHQNLLYLNETGNILGTNPQRAGSNYTDDFIAQYPFVKVPSVSKDIFELEEYDIPVADRPYPNVTRGIRIRTDRSFPCTTTPPQRDRYRIQCNYGALNGQSQDDAVESLCAQDGRYAVTRYTFVVLDSNDLSSGKELYIEIDGKLTPANKDTINMGRGMGFITKTSVQGGEKVFKVGTKTIDFEDNQVEIFEVLDEVVTCPRISQGCYFVDRNYNPTLSNITSCDGKTYTWNGSTWLQRFNTAGDACYIKNNAIPPSQILGFEEVQPNDVLFVNCSNTLYYWYWEQNIWVDYNPYDSNGNESPDPDDTLPGIDDGTPDPFGGGSGGGGSTIGGGGFNTGGGTPTTGGGGGTNESIGGFGTPEDPNDTFGGF